MTNALPKGGSASQMIAVRASVDGRVQGVGYRDWADSEAKRRGLAGWVRNRRDGTVEIMLSGEKAVVEDMLVLLWQGPPAARVTRVTSSPAPPPMGLGFRVLPTT